MKPIMFNTEMVRAIQEGRKTVTRRVVKQQPVGKIKPMPMVNEWPNYWRDDSPDSVFATPYHPGDVLYVRETWCWCPCWDCGMLSEDGTTCHDDNAKRVYSETKGEYGCFCYKASCKDNEVPSVDAWHPSIHMPKEVARLFLRVTGVRAERLQDCGNAQAKDEGCTCCSQFARVWDRTIKPKEMRLYGWEANPWVWVIEFERISKEEAQRHG